MNVAKFPKLVGNRMELVGNGNRTGKQTRIGTGKQTGIGIGKQTGTKTGKQNRNWNRQAKPELEPASKIGIINGTKTEIINWKQQANRNRHCVAKMEPVCNEAGTGWRWIRRSGGTGYWTRLDHTTN